MDRQRLWPAEIGIEPYYQDASVLIYNADCREILPLLPKVDLLLTDPPYGIALKNNGIMNFKRSNWGKIVGDESTDLAIELSFWWGGPLAMFFSPYQSLPVKWRSILVWDKGGHVGGGGDVKTCWKRDFELIGIRNNRPLHGQRDSAILSYPGLFSAPSGNPAEKPVELLRYLVHKLSDDNHIILDPFMGSGTTLVAAQSLGRKSIGIEIEEKYCEIAVERLRQKPLPLDFTEPELPEQPRLDFGSAHAR